MVQPVVFYSCLLQISASRHKMRALSRGKHISTLGGPCSPHLLVTSAWPCPISTTAVSLTSAWPSIRPHPPLLLSSVLYQWCCCSLPSIFLSSARPWVRPRPPLILLYIVYCWCCWLLFCTINCRFLSTPPFFATLSLLLVVHLPSAYLSILCCHCAIFWGGTAICAEVCKTTNSTDILSVFCRWVGKQVN